LSSIGASEQAQLGRLNRRAE